MFVVPTIPAIGEPLKEYWQVLRWDSLNDETPTLWRYTTYGEAFTCFTDEQSNAGWDTLQLEYLGVDANGKRTMDILWSEVSE